MKERSILFSTPMVKAILEGRKTQTRRIVKPQPFDIGGSAFMKTVNCPYGQPGDRLWVREAWTVSSTYDSVSPLELPDNLVILYNADGLFHSAARRRASIHMPRWASRITLEVTEVRVERLQDISAPDALAEGCGKTPCARCDESGESEGEVCEDCAGEGWFSEVQNYRQLWESINGPGSWDANPWVWVIEFNRIKT